MSATAESVPFTATRPGGRPGLRREIGFIGLLWASGGSIIGSGWLFGAQGALATAGPAAIISWVVGAVAILLLALVHAELGAMWPVAGGTARFPHSAFGGAVGASFGWFSWLQAATVAPIEVMAVIQYSQHYSFANSWMKVSGGQNVLTATGVVVAIVLMAIFTAVNFLSVRKLAHTNSTATWWKVGIPVLTIIVLALSGLHSANFSAADGFAPTGAGGVLAAVSTSGIVFALLGFEQADQLAGESANPKRDIPRAVIGAIAIGAVIYILLQVVFLAAMPPSQIGATWAGSPFATFSGPFAQLATLVGVGWLATILYIDAVISPAGTGLIYTTALVAGLLRAQPQRLRAEGLRAHRPPRRPVGRADHRVRDRLRVLPAVPELAVAGRPDHERQRADVRGRAAGARRLPASACRTPNGRTGSRRRACSRRSRSWSPTS